MTCFQLCERNTSEFGGGGSFWSLKEITEKLPLLIRKQDTSFCWYKFRYVLVIGCQCQLAELASPFGSRVDAKGNRRCYAMPSGFLSWNVKKSRSESRKLIKSKWWDQKSSIWVLYVTLFSTLHMFCVLSSTWHFHLLGDAGQRQVESWILSINSISVPSLGKLSSGQVVPAAPRPTDSEPCGCPDSLPKTATFWWFLVVLLGCFIVSCNLVGPYLWLWHLLRTRLSSWLFQATVKRRFSRKVCGFPCLSKPEGAAQHATKRPAMVWRRIWRSRITPFPP